MASFPKMTTTSAGQRLLTKAMAGAALQFTKIVLGDGQLNGVSISTLTALISQKAYCGITFEKSTGTTYQVGGLLLPENITTGFYWREVGLIALDPDDSSEVLFSYSNDGTATDYIDPNVTDSRFEKNIYISTGISTASSVTVEIPSSDTYALQDFSNVSAEVIIAAVENSGLTFEAPIKDQAAKTTPVDADAVPVIDSADSSKTKLTTWANIKAALKTFFDSIYAAATHTHTKSQITDFPASMMPTAHAASHKTDGTDALAAGDINAATKPAIVTVTFATASWTLNATSNCYEQTVACEGLLAADSYNIDAVPVGSTDAAAQALTDAAYAVMAGPGGRMACDTDGQLYARCPAGAAAPTINFQVAVVISR